MARNDRAHYETQEAGSASTRLVELSSFRQNLLERRLSATPAAMPDELQPFHLASAGERNRRIRRTLVEAFVVWRAAAGEVSMVDAVRMAGGEQFAIAEHGLQVMRRVLLELNLTAWEEHPARLRSDVRALFRRAIRKVDVHRGGWRVRSHA